MERQEAREQLKGQLRAYVVGKVDNNPDGRSLLRATLIEYFNELQRLNAIQE